MNKDRGKFLTLMLIFAAFGSLISLYQLTNTNALQQTYGPIPSWFTAYAILGSLAGVAVIIGIWMWKKWAVYLLAFSTAVTFLMQLFVLKPVQYGEFVYYMTIVSAGLWFWAIYRKWKYFS